MNKEQKRLHDQKLINVYNLRLTQIDRVLAKDDVTPFMVSQFRNQRHMVLNKLAKLYGIEQHDLVHA